MARMSHCVHRMSRIGYSKIALAFVALSLAAQTTLPAFGAKSAAHKRSTAVKQPRLRSPFVRASSREPLPNGPLVTLRNADYPGGTGHVSKVQYEDLRNGIVALLERYHPNRHYFIGT